MLFGPTGCKPPVADPRTTLPSTAAFGGWFTETAARSGLVFQHRSGAEGRYWIPEMMGGGVGLLDYDNDGLLDVVCVQSGSLPPGRGGGSRLFRNLGQLRFADVTEQAGFAHVGYGMGVACADIDNDGDVDVVITNLGGCTLLRNEGKGMFAEVTKGSGLETAAWGTSATFFDYDGDGWLDLFVANYLRWSPEGESPCYSRGGARDYCSPMNYKAPCMDTLYRNLGGGRFKDVTEEAGLGQAYGNGLGVTSGDFNGDGRLDLFVANDAMPNQLWIQQAGGGFKDEALLRGCAVNVMGLTRAGMGVVGVDLLQRGAWDLFVTHLVGEGNGLFLSTNQAFVDTVLPKGPGAASFARTGFGLGFADFDNDGSLDLYVGNGRVKLGQDTPSPTDPYAEPNTLLRGLGSGEFEEVPAGGVEPALVATSRGVAVGDLDNDGGVEVVIVNRDGPVHLLKNRAGTGRNWVLLDVRGAAGRQAINAVVEVESGGKRFWRRVQPNEGYCSAHDPRVHVGLGDRSNPVTLLVTWPGGGKEAFGPLPVNRVHTLRQGEGLGAGR